MICVFSNHSVCQGRKRFKLAGVGGLDYSEAVKNARDARTSTDSMAAARA